MKKALFGLMLLALPLAAQPELIGGKPADLKDFPASVYAHMSGAACSATVIGPRTLLIAAHCVSNGGTASFSVGSNQYTSKCTHAPQYDQEAWQKLYLELLKPHPNTKALATENATADWTLCKVDREVTGIQFETLETRDAPLAVGDTPLLTGYGCIRPGGGGGNDGILRIGRATVQSLPDTGTDNDVVTAGSAALCYGDSGGGFYCTKDGSNTERTVCGVNSRGDIRTTSYLSATFTPMAKAFFQDWKKKNSEKICGYDVLPQCRGAVPAVPVDFTLESADLILKATVQPGAVYTPADAKNALQSAVDSLSGK